MFDYHSSAKRRPYFPTLSCNNTHKPWFFPLGKYHSEHEFLHHFVSSKVRNSCTEKKLRIQEAPIYGLFELSFFAEEIILNAGNHHNMPEA